MSKDYITDFVKGFEEWNIYSLKASPFEQLRALFATYCIINGIDVDTYIADSLLAEIFNLLNIEISFEEFENYMVEYIV